MSDRDDPALLVNDQGIIRYRSDGIQRVEWGKLVEVSVLTTDAGPQQNDVFFVLQSEGGSRFLIPSDVPESQQVLDAGSGCRVSTTRRSSRRWGPPPTPGSFAGKRNPDRFPLEPQGHAVAVGVPGQGRSLYRQNDSRYHGGRHGDSSQEPWNDLAGHFPHRVGAPPPFRGDHPQQRHLAGHTGHRRGGCDLASELEITAGCRVPALCRAALYLFRLAATR